MRQIRIKNNTAMYQDLLKSPDAGRAGMHMTDEQIEALPKDVYVLTGDKTEDFGGGPSPDGFVMSAANRILGRVWIKDRRGPVEGFLFVP
jgi:hypothetical protein